LGTQTHLRGRSIAVWQCAAKGFSLAQAQDTSLMIADVLVHCPHVVQGQVEAWFQLCLFTASVDLSQQRKCATQTLLC
jgi:hypothetical protein